MISNIHMLTLNFHCIVYYYFFFNDTATTEIYTLSLHDALPIYALLGVVVPGTSIQLAEKEVATWGRPVFGDRKSTRLNSSHMSISYAVFCLKKKNKEKNTVLHKV